MIEIIKEKEYAPETGEKLENAVGLCACGREVELSGFTNTCDCGRDYNWEGCELAPRSQWGEETGETADEILQGVAQDEVEQYPLGRRIYGKRSPQTLRLEPEFARRLKHILLDKDESFQSVTERLLRDYVAAQEVSENEQPLD